MEQAAHDAVRAGVVWFISGPVSLFREELPAGILSDAATLNQPPGDIAPTTLLPQNLPAAWSQSVTTAATLSQALSVAQGKSLPWTTVRASIDAAIRARLLELVADSGPWPCDWPGSASVRLQVPPAMPSPPAPLPPPPGRKHAEAELQPSELQDFVDGLSDFVKAGAGLNLRFVLRLEAGNGDKMKAEQIARLNEILAKMCSKLRFQ